MMLDRVNSVEEAVQVVERARCGTWEPRTASPPALPTVWASPVPRDFASHGMGADFELVIQDLDSDVPWKRAMSSLDETKSTSKHSRFELEQLLQSPGSLPNPMYPDEREMAIRELKPTATFEMLSQVPRDFLRTATPEAQELRRKLTRGATVVFVSAGYPGKRFIFERAAALGVKSVIIDHPDSWSRNLVQEGVIAKFLPVDMSQSSAEVFRQAEAAIRELGQDSLTGSACAITTFVELACPLAARLCEIFGLPGFRPESVDLARDKHRTRAALRAANLPTPRNALIHDAGEIIEAARIVGFPAVLKPVSGAASLGVKKVTTLRELEASYREVADELCSLVVSSGALVKATDGVTGVKADSVVDLTVLLEQYLDGQEVDVDIVMSEGEWRYAAVSDNGPTLEPYFNETWGLCPSMMTKSKQNELKELSVSCVKALGFTTGVFHVECKYTSSGPQLIEVNARMGGGPVRECNRLVWGVDLVEEAIFCALGIPARPVAVHTPSTCIGYAFVNAQKSGILASTQCIEDLRGHDGVLSADPLVKAGDKVVGRADGMPTWLCLLVAQGKSSESALKFVQRLEAELLVQFK